MEQLNQLEQTLGYTFTNRALLSLALTHSSFINENRGKGETSNERLEFLGDSVLGMVMAEHLFTRFPKVPEGELSKIRSAVVCESSLAVLARRLGLGSYLKMGRGEEKNGGRNRASILSDAMEAVIAAIYLDSGLDTVRPLIVGWLHDAVEETSKSGGMEEDYKTRLQEYAQQDNRTITYRLVGEKGPDHAKIFITAVFMNDQELARGEGQSKKKAEQSAAQTALAKLNQ